MVPTAQESRQQAVCTHGVRGLDPNGVCIPCRDEQVFCWVCARPAVLADWLRYDRQCEDCFDEQMLIQKVQDDLTWLQGQQSARAAVGAELRAQDRGGA